MKRRALLGALCGAWFGAVACVAAEAPPPPPPAGVRRYLALGDSFTIGTGAPPEAAFPARLVRRWAAARPGSPVELRNLAVNGYTTQHLIDAEIPGVRPFAPELVTLAIGANDIVAGSSPEQYRRQLRRIFALLREAGVPGRRVVALPQPDWSRSPAAPMFADPPVIRERIDLFNQILRQEAQAAGARYVDLFPLMRRQAERGLFAGDGLHPSAAAYDEWAEALARACGTM